MCRKIRKITTILVCGLLGLNSVFALDMTVGLKGIVGNENTDSKGASFGGGVDLNLDLYKGFGLEIESNIITSKMYCDEGLVVTDNFQVNIPVMAWYNAKFNRFGLGGGFGLNCNIASQSEDAAFKMGLAAGLQTNFFVNDSFAIVLGATGALDCFPTLTKSANGNSSVYNFKASDFSRNSLYGTLGVQYKIPLPGKSN